MYDEETEKVMEPHVSPANRSDGSCSGCRKPAKYRVSLHCLEIRLCDTCAKAMCKKLK